jgi:pyrroline-5-carboxylate reductase
MARDQDDAPDKVRLLTIGAGRMGGALVQGWLDAQIDAEITAIDPNLSELEYSRLEAAGVQFSEGPDDLHGQFNAVVLAVKPQVLREAAGPYKRATEGALVISVAAGIRIATLEGMFGPRTAIVRAMPNLPAQVGMGVTAYFPNARVNLSHMELTERLLSAVGTTIAVTAEDQLDAVTAVSGSGPAYVFLLCEALENAAMEAGLDPEAAQILARATVAGSGGLLGMTEEDASFLRESVTSPGGTTAAALNLLMDEKTGLQSLMTRAVLAARDRAKQLAE